MIKLPKAVKRVAATFTDKELRRLYIDMMIQAIRAEEHHRKFGGKKDKGAKTEE
jgi:hypothetical protein